MIIFYPLDKQDPHLQMNKFCDYKMFFDINSISSSYTFITDSEFTGPTDILILNSFSKNKFANYPAALKLYFEIFHNYEHQIKNIYFNNYDDCISDLFNKINCYTITNAVDSAINSTHIIYNDFLFNRTKAYYSQYTFNSDTHKWYHVGDQGYIIPDLLSAENKQKIFVAPNNIHPGSTQDKDMYRKKIITKLKEHYKLGYIGSIETDPLFFLYPHHELPDITSVTKIENREFPLTSKRLGGYMPPHNEYYKNTFVSIYGETIEQGNSIAVTEKTYDPLIKGHFILPFSTSGFIDFLKIKGFIFPNFIDYTYDNIVDNDARYLAYEKEIDRLLNIPISEWRLQWMNNLDLIKHNKKVFQETTYDRIRLDRLMS